MGVMLSTPQVQIKKVFLLLFCSQKEVLPSPYGALARLLA
jgi:hypothetical protein